MLVFGDATSWVIELLYYNARQFITLLNIRGGVKSWVSLSPHEQLGFHITGVIELNEQLFKKN